MKLLLAFFDDDVQAKILQRISDEGVDDENERVVYLRSSVIGLLEQACVDVFVDHEDEILAGTFEGSLVKHIPERQRAAYETCVKLSVKRIYNSKVVLDTELAGYKIIETLMQTFIGAVTRPEQFHSQQLLHLVSSQYDIDADDLETRVMAVVDYICGMTDVYALELYQKINGLSLPIV